MSPNIQLIKLDTKILLSKTEAVVWRKNAGLQG